MVRAPQLCSFLGISFSIFLLAIWKVDKFRGAISDGASCDGAAIDSLSVKVGVLKTLQAIRGGRGHRMGRTGGSLV